MLPDDVVLVSRRGAGNPPHLHGRRGARRAQPDAEERGEDSGEVGDGGAGVDEVKHEPRIYSLGRFAIDKRIRPYSIKTNPHILRYGIKCNIARYNAPINQFLAVDANFIDTDCGGKNEHYDRSPLPIRMNIIHASKSTYFCRCS